MSASIRTNKNSYNEKNENNTNESGCVCTSLSTKSSSSTTSYQAACQRLIEKLSTLSERIQRNDPFLTVLEPNFIVSDDCFFDCCSSSTCCCRCDAKNEEGCCEIRQGQVQGVIQAAEACVCGENTDVHYKTHDNHCQDVENHQLVSNTTSPGTSTSLSATTTRTTTACMSTSLLFPLSSILETDDGQIAFLNFVRSLLRYSTSIYRENENKTVLLSSNITKVILRYVSEPDLHLLLEGICALKKVQEIIILTATPPVVTTTMTTSATTPVQVPEKTIGVLSSTTTIRPKERFSESCYGFEFFSNNSCGCVENKRINNSIATRRSSKRGRKNSSSQQRMPIEDLTNLLLSKDDGFFASIDDYIDDTASTIDRVNDAGDENDENDTVAQVDNRGNNIAYMNSSHSINNSNNSSIDNSGYSNNNHNNNSNNKENTTSEQNRSNHQYQSVVRTELNTGSDSLSMVVDKVEGIVPSYGWRSINIDCRIQVRNMDQVQELARGLAVPLNVSTLQHLHIHLLPRCSIDTPTIELNCIFMDALCHCYSLETISIKLGYDYNPYGGTPMISPDALYRFLHPSNNSIGNRSNNNNNNSSQQRSLSKSLHTVKLYNFGITSQHVYIIAELFASHYTLTSDTFVRYGTNRNSTTSSTPPITCTTSTSNGSRLRCLYLVLNRDDAFTTSSLLVLNESLRTLVETLQHQLLSNNNNDNNYSCFNSTNDIRSDTKTNVGRSSTSTTDHIKLQNNIAGTTPIIQEVVYHNLAQFRLVSNEQMNTLRHTTKEYDEYYHSKEQQQQHQQQRSNFVDAIQNFCTSGGNSNSSVGRKRKRIYNDPALEQQYRLCSLHYETQYYMRLLRVLRVIHQVHYQYSILQNDRTIESYDATASNDINEYYVDENENEHCSNNNNSNSNDSSNNNVKGGVILKSFQNFSRCDGSDNSSTSSTECFEGLLSSLLVVIDTVVVAASSLEYFKQEGDDEDEDCDDDTDSIDNEHALSITYAILRYDPTVITMLVSYGRSIRASSSVKSTELRKHHAPNSRQYQSHRPHVTSTTNRQNNLTATMSKEGTKIPPKLVSVAVVDEECTGSYDQQCRHDCTIHPIQTNVDSCRSVIRHDNNSNSHQVHSGSLSPLPTTVTSLSKTITAAKTYDHDGNYHDNIPLRRGRKRQRPL